MAWQRASRYLAQQWLKWHVYFIKERFNSNNFVNIHFGIKYHTVSFHFANDDCKHACFGLFYLFSYAYNPLGKEYIFLHDRPWISSWIKTISNELDIIIQAIASQLSSHCDVISNRLWCQQQNCKRSEWDTGSMCQDNCFYHHLWNRYVVLEIK